MTTSEAIADAQRRLFLLDGHSLAYRAFFALPMSLATTTGQVTNAVYGFTSMVIKLLTEERPDLIAVAFDMGAPTVRLEMDAEYKAGRRETPTDFTSQLGLISEVLETLRIPIVRVEGHEADDALGTLAVRAAAAGHPRHDRHRRPGLLPARRARHHRDVQPQGDLRHRELRRGRPSRSGSACRRSKYLEYVALKGDPSDNIPGVPGVGEKTATKLVQQYGSVEEILAHTERAEGQAAGERRGRRGAARR